MVKKKSKRAQLEEAVENEETKPLPTARKITYATFPVPRRVVVDSELSRRYVKPGHLAFVNGFDRSFQPQALDWAELHPDLTRPYYDEEELKTALPQSWPNNMTLLAPEQQYQEWVIKPVHGGLTWPGHPAPKLRFKESIISGLPGPLKRFFA